jgi:hypothetical protein
MLQRATPKTGISWRPYVCGSCHRYPLTFIGQDDSPGGGRSVYKCSACGVKSASTASRLMSPADEAVPDQTNRPDPTPGRGVAR